MGIGSWIRKYKIFYMVFNLFKRNQLKHNEEKYEQLGLRKRYFSPISSADFKHLPAERIGDDIDLQKLRECRVFKNASFATREHLLEYPQNGYAILPGFLSRKEVASILEEVERLKDSGKVNPLNNGRIMFAIHHSQILRETGKRNDLMELLEVLLEGPVSLFQSINFEHGSEQGTHSDSFHMTTYPPGGLLGAWFALEEIESDNGPLHYYPGSHRLPYFNNSDFGNVGTKWRLGSGDYSDYKKMIRGKIRENHLEKEVLSADAGDLLIWHANLLHGGEPHRNPNKTRKSMVLHYFRKDVICYHEISERPALIRPL